MQRVCDDHTEILSFTDIVVEFTEKVCWMADQAITHHCTAKSQASYLIMLKETIWETLKLLLYLIFWRIIHFCMKVPYKGSSGKVIRLLSSLLWFLITYQGKKIAWKKSVSFCVMSDCLLYTSTTGHSLMIFIPHHLVSDVLPHLKNVWFQWLCRFTVQEM
jgi:hypothetical protein